MEKGKKKGLELDAVWKGVIANLRKDYFGDDSGSLPRHLSNQLKDYVEEVYKAADKVKAVKNELSPFLPKEKEEPSVYAEATVVAKDLSKKGDQAAVPGGKPAKDSEFKSAMDLKLKEMETAHASELALLKKQRLESEQTEQFYNLSVISSDAAYYQKRLDKLQEFLKKAGSDKMKAEIDKRIVEAQTDLLDIEQKRDKEKLAALRDNRDKRLGIEERTYTAQKVVIEKMVAERQLTEEDANVSLLFLETEYAGKRLDILRDHQKDVHSMEIKNGPVKAKAVDESNKAVLEADLKAAKDRSALGKAIQEADQKEQATLSGFKKQFNLLTIKEETDIQVKVLEAAYKTRKDMLVKANKSTLELDKALEQARTNILKEGEDKRRQVRQQYGLVSISEQNKIERDELKKQREAGVIDEKEYQKALFDMRVRHLKAYYDYYKDLFSGAISTLQEAELANIDAKYDVEIKRAGDNTEEVARLENEKEAKKLAVQKKYAGVQFAIKVSEIIANTAVAIMQAFAQMGPIGGAIAAAMLVATGAAQVAVANAERKKIMNMTVDSGSSSGTGTGSRVVTGGGTPGYYEGGYSGDGSPLEVAGPVHKREYVVPSFVMSEPVAMNHVLALEAIRRQRTSANPLPVNGFANGGYYGRGDDGELPPDNDDPELIRILSLLYRLLSGLNERGIKAYVVYSDIEAAQKTLDKSKKIGGK